MTNIFTDIIFGEHKRIEIVLNTTLSDFYDEFVKNFATFDKSSDNGINYTGKTYGTIENNQIKIWYDERSPFSPIFNGIISDNNDKEIKIQGKFGLNYISSIMMLIILFIPLLMFFIWTSQSWNIELGFASIIFLIISSLSLSISVYKSRNRLKTIRNKLKMINK